MSLSHQSLRKFDTFINFVQIYLLTQKLGTIQAQKPVPFTWRCICWNELFLPHRALQSNFTKESKRRGWMIWFHWAWFIRHLRGERYSQGHRLWRKWDVLFRALCLRKRVNRKSCKTVEDTRHSQHHFSLLGYQPEFQVAEPPINLPGLLMTCEWKDLL